jgi:hypothetical protein
MNVRLRVLAAGLVAAGIVLPGLPAGTATAQEAADLSTITALAIASGQRASVFTTGTQAVSDFFDGVGPVAESRFDGLGGGQSLASLPYPGATIRQYPAYVALAGGGEVPGYPFYVSAHPGEPEAKQADPTGTYLLEAKASREAASSLAQLRGGGEAFATGSVSTTSIKIEGSKVVATAESITEGLSAGALKIASVYSKSVTTYTPGDAEPKTATEVRIDGGAIDDQRFSFGPEGLTVSTQGVPIPVAQGVETLNTVFRQDGLSVRLLAPERIAGGAQAGTLEISATRDLPGGGAGVLRLRFGQAASAVVPGGDLLPSTPVDDVAGSSEVSAPADPTPEPTVADDTVPDLSAALSEDAGFATGSADLAAPFQPGFGGDGLGATTGEQTAAADAATTPPEVALTTPRTPGQSARRPGRMAAAATVRAVDGVYAAVAWATLAILGLGLIWRQGARKWTS